MRQLHKQHFFCSWSGGKDSCLALYRAIKQGGTPKRLLTMLTETGNRSRSHGLHPQLLHAQSEALGIPLTSHAASWNDYEKVFLSALTDFTNAGIANGVFGDIDLEPHREWVERVCSQAGINAFLPLWQEQRHDLLDEFLNAGFAATIIAVNESRLDTGFLGRRLDRQTIADLEKAGVDACGEEGEYHTVVTDGPLFSQPLRIQHGDMVTHDGYSFLNILLDTNKVPATVKAGKEMHV